MIENSARNNALVATLVSADRIFAEWRLPQMKKDLINLYFEKPFQSFFQILRVYDVTFVEFNGNNANQFYEFILRQSQTHWLIKGLKPNRSYCLELGIKVSEANFFPLLRSDTVQVPSLSLNDVTDKVENKRTPAEEIEPPVWSGRVSTYSYYGSHAQLGSRSNDRETMPRLPSTPSVSPEYQEKGPSLQGHFDIEVERKNWSKLKIVMLSWEFPPNVVGGLARHVDGLSRGLAKMDCEIHVVTTQTVNLKAFEVIEDVHIHRVKPLHQKEPVFLTWVADLNSVMIDKVTELAANHQFDVIHAHDWLVSSAALILKKQLKLPLVATIHSTESGRNNGIYTDVQAFIHEKERQLVEAANQLIVCSEFMKDELKHVFKTSGTNQVIIPNGIDYDPETEISNTMLKNLPLNKKIIFTIGRMVKEKGFETIIEAAIPLLEAHPDIHFVLAGKGPMLEEYKRLVTEKGLQDDVTFLGYINEQQRNQLLQHCYLAVFPSLYEPFGIVSLESMVHAKPTIVSNTGGLKGIIKHMETGLLMKPGNSASLIKQVQFLLENESIALQLGQQGKNIVKKLYSWQRIGIETRRIYEEARYQEKCL